MTAGTQQGGQEGPSTATPRVLDAILSSPTPPDVTIVLADGSELPAHSFLLRMHSTCARGCPEPFDKWHLDALKLGEAGAPPTADIVLSWLEWVYWQTLIPQGAAAALIMDALPLLQFADAVGTSPVLLGNMARACQWVITATHPDRSSVAPARVEFCNRQAPQPGVKYYYQSSSPHMSTTPTVDLMEQGRRALLSSLTAAHTKVIAHQLAEQLEQLLHLGLQAGLDELVDCLLPFVRCHTGTSSSLLPTSELATVFSPRVVIALPRVHLLNGFLKWMAKDDKFCIADA